MLISPPKKRLTSYGIHVLPLLNRRGWKQLSQKMYVFAICFVQCYKAYHVIKV